jgi:hypothetical protein
LRGWNGDFIVPPTIHTRLGEVGGRPRMAIPSETENGFPFFLKLFESLFPIRGFSWYTYVLDALSNTHSNPVSVCVSETETETETESIQQISSLLAIEPSIMSMRTVE